MPVYILEGSSSATLLPGTLTVTLTSSGVFDSVRLTCIQQGDGLSPASQVIAPRPGMVVLPSLRGRTVVGVAPQGSTDVFPEGTVVSVSLSTARGHEEDGERAVLNHVDVSGLSFRDLVSVEPGPSGLVVSALDAVAEDALGPLASAARMTARAVLGLPRVAPEDAVDLLFGLDTSASMSTCVADGSLLAALDVLTGVSQVVAPGRRVRVALLGDRPRTLPDMSAADLSRQAVEALGAAPVSSGFRPRLPPPDGSGPAVTYLLTDGPCGPLENGPADRGRQHAVVLAPTSAWSVLSRSASSGSSGPVTFVPVPGDDGDSGSLDEPQVLRQVVASLLSSCFPADSPLAERLTS